MMFSQSRRAPSQLEPKCVTQDSSELEPKSKYAGQVTGAAMVD